MAVKFEETKIKREVVFLSQDDETLLVLKCDKYSKYRETRLKDIVLILASSKKPPDLPAVDKVKYKKMHDLLKKNKAKRLEINLESEHDFSGIWSEDCEVDNGGVLIKALRDDVYHFLLCSSFKCINYPRLSSKEVTILDNTHLRISGRTLEFCKAVDK